LDRYNSAESAADVEDLRIAMGYHQIDILGISYGTRLALTVMRDYPESIRSVILDSVYPPNVDAINVQPLITVQAIETLFQGCKEDMDCNQAYPQLEDVFYDIVAELNAEPADVSYYDEIYEEHVDEVLYGDDVVYMLVDSFYDTRVIPYLPAFIDAMAEGKYEHAYEILDMPYMEDDEAYIDDGDYYNEAYEDVSDSEGMYYSVECREEIYFNDVETAEDLVADFPFVITEGFIWEVEDLFVACDTWGTTPAPALENQAVSSDIPTLLLVGEYDPVTPPSFAEAAAEHLRKAQLFTFPGYGHALIDAGPCPVAMMLDFLADPFSPVDSSCMSDIEIIDFVVDP
jgi:pimeloyl-ACP methyl ester carboxylesterase